MIFGGNWLESNRERMSFYPVEIGREEIRINKEFFVVKIEDIVIRPRTAIFLPW